MDLQPEEQATQVVVRFFDLFMLGLCIYVLIALAVETLFTLDAATSRILAWADTAICLIFLADFFYKLTVAEHRLQYLRWGWIDFVSSIPSIGILRVGRAARAVRILRVLRGMRSTKMLVDHILRHRAESAFTAAAFLAIVLLIFSSIAILAFETGAGTNINGAEDALWWAFVTMTTVGYGDTYPVTTEGRLVAALLMTAGVGLFGTFTGFVASWFLGPGEKEQEDELGEISQRLAAIEKKLDSNNPARDDQEPRP